MLFIAATADAKFRAFESHSGKVWLTKLDSVGNATPITCRGRDGKQYVVIVAGGVAICGNRRFRRAIS